MDVIILESHHQLEPALFLNYLGNFDFLNFVMSSLWTWVAVLAAAALSLWRIKSSTTINSDGGGDDGYVLLHPQQQPSPHKEEEEEEEEINKLVRKSSIIITPSSSSSSSCDSSCTRVNEFDYRMTKEKFIVYLEKNNDNVGNDNDEDIINCNYVRLEYLDEVMSYVVRRNVDLGWYRYQDITALSGSVVKLWDGGRL